MFSQMSAPQRARYRCSARYLLSSVRVTDVQPDIYSLACALPMFSQMSTLQRACARMTSVDDLRLNVFHIHILMPFNFHLILFMFMWLHPCVCRLYLRHSHTKVSLLCSTEVIWLGRVNEDRISLSLDDAVRPYNITGSLPSKALRMR